MNIALEHSLKKLSQLNLQSIEMPKKVRPSLGKRTIAITSPYRFDSV